MIKRKVLEQFRVKPGKRVRLKDYDPGWVGSSEARELSSDELKESSRAILQENLEKLSIAQGKLYADDSWSVLVVLQAMDAAGKDGMVKHVMSGLNPQGCDVHSFKAPSHEELDHSFLWRIMRVSPAKGMITIFNRSHYEEVLVVRVHPHFLQGQRIPPELITKRIWQERYEDINNYERHLARNGTIILKFFLHISRDEQKKRFIERLENPEKNWKFSAHDVEERQHWDEYMKAYEETLTATSTSYAPWYIIPANKKAVARAMVSSILTHTINGMNLDYPKIDEQQRLDLEEARRRLLSE